MKKSVFFIFLFFCLISSGYSKEVSASEYLTYLIQGDYAPQKITFSSGDTVVFQQYLFVVCDVVRGSDGSFIYLLAGNGGQEFSHCCYLICHRQLNMIFLDGQQMINETIIGKFLCMEEYKRGFQFLQAECFVDVNY